MTTKKQNAEQPQEAVPDATGFNAKEYAEVHRQRMALIRSYNMWFAIGCAIAFGTYWLMLNLGLTIGSRPMLVAGTLVASTIMWFAYRAVLSIDREVVGHYPRIVFLELMLGYDFYRDYLRRRPRGNSERSFVEKCEHIKFESTEQLWQEIYSHFNQKDFPASRRLSTHFKRATILSVVLFVLITALILGPQYFPLAK